MTPTASIVIPIHKADLSETEELAFSQCLKVLGSFEIILAVPEGLQLSFLTTKNPHLKTEEFPPEYFSDISGYNRLMLSHHFYEKFLEFDYILIHQLDAFVFRDELLYWCQKGFDYIGAPWIASTGPINKFLRLIKPKIRKREPIFYKVGNGGLSLRKTRTFYNVSRSLEDTINQQINVNSEEIYAIEDVFWSLKAPMLVKDFTIPSYKEAARFALDRKPKLGLKINDYNLPFGCHGFNKPKVYDFWMPIIKKTAEENNLTIFGNQK